MGVFNGRISSRGSSSFADDLMHFQYSLHFLFLLTQDGIHLICYPAKYAETTYFLPIQKTKLNYSSAINLAASAKCISRLFFMQILSRVKANDTADNLIFRTIYTYRLWPFHPWASMTLQNSYKLRSNQCW